MMHFSNVRYLRRALPKVTISLLAGYTKVSHSNRQLLYPDLELPPPLNLRQIGT
jgi:hypothetical protein